jgi:glycerophosphoryl diester phosphodiesterase
MFGSKEPENSLEAFQKAVDNGYGIELDVQLSADGQAVVFHDANLLRLFGENVAVSSLTVEELAEYGIPTLAEALELIDGKVPVIVEMKGEDGDISVAPITAEILDEYVGDYCVESFNPLSLKTVKDKRPKLVRGILSHRYYEYEQYRKPMYFALQSLLLNVVCRPAFIAYDHKHASSFALRSVRKLFNVPTLAWTVRSQEEENIALKNGFDGIIFENYIPKI